ncbi:MAG TPA: ASCH domain-containing protein [Paucimonas sp.]|nr:ASCH domain-containing protein [Paucimonas sp.]
MPPIAVPEKLKPFWQAFSSQWNGDADARFYEAFYFCDNEQDAEELGQLVLAGTKRATASLLMAHEAEGKPLPEVGALSIVTNWSGEPLCVIETTRVDIVPFDQVTAEFAATEGEGDKSLAYWREGHWRFFSRECQQLGLEPSSDMLVVCERFQVVYPHVDRTAC